MLKESLRRYLDGTGRYNKYGYDSLDFRCRSLFEEALPLEGKDVLEIGAGKGWYALWAAAQGANVVALEPEGDGSQAGVISGFHAMQKALGPGAEKATMLNSTLQAYDGGGRSFDIVLSQSSINHLDEPACERIEEPANRQKYVSMFGAIRRLCRDKGHFVISDAGAINYWDKVGLTPPLARTIEWNKHQEPEVWGAIAEEGGFKVRSIKWHQFYPLRHFGPLFSNRHSARLLTSHFVLTLEAS